MKIALTKEQMKTLIKLGVDVSNAQFSYVCGELKWFDRACRETTEMDCMPALTLSDLLDILPKIIDDGEYLDERYMVLVNGYDKCTAMYSYFDGSEAFNSKGVCSAKEPIDALYELVVWCVKNGYIKSVYL